MQKLKFVLAFKPNKTSVFRKNSKRNNTWWRHFWYDDVTTKNFSILKIQGRKTNSVQNVSFVADSRNELGV